MADPFSLIAAAIGVLDVGIRTGSELASLGRAWLTAPDEIMAVQNEVSDLQAVLHHSTEALRSVPLGLANNRASFASALNAQLEQARALLDDLSLIVNKILAMTPKRRRAMWTRERSSVNGIRTKLREPRARIHEMLISHGLYVFCRLRDGRVWDLNCYQRSTSIRIGLELVGVRQDLQRTQRETLARLNSCNANLETASDELVSIRNSVASMLHTSSLCGLETASASQTSLAWILSALKESETRQSEILSRLDRLISPTIAGSLDGRTPTHAHSHGLRPRCSDPTDAVTITFQRRFANCSVLCGCSCHTRSARSTRRLIPSALQKILGSFFLGYSVLPTRTKLRCDASSCRAQRSAYIMISYTFPSYFLSASIFASFQMASTCEKPTFGLFFAPQMWYSPSNILGAAHWGNVDRVEYHLSVNPAYVACQSVERGQTALSLAIQGLRKALGRSRDAAKYEAYLRIIKMLLHSGASLDRPDYNGISPRLTLAGTLVFQTGPLPPRLSEGLGRMINIADCIEELGVPHLGRIMDGLSLSGILKDPACRQNINTRDKLCQCTLLHFAVLHHQVTAVRELLQAGADPNIRNLCNTTPLHHAMRSRRPKSTLIAWLLAKHGATLDLEPNALNKPGLHLACPSNSIPVVKMLMQFGSEARFSRYYETPLPHAILNDSIDVVRHIVKEGGDIEQAGHRIYSDGYTPLLLAVAARAAQCLRYLLRKKANHLVRAASGRSILHVAAKFPDAAIMSLLESHGLRGVDVSARDKRGLTARHLFKRHGPGVKLISAFDRLTKAIDTANREGGAGCEDDTDDDVFFDAQDGGQ